MQDKILITVPEFLERYSISRTSLYKEIKAGRLRLLKRNRRSLIAHDDAQAWVDLLKQETASRGAI